MSETMLSAQAAPVAEAPAIVAEAASTNAAASAPAEAAPAETKTEAPAGAPESYTFNAAEGKEFDPAVLTPFSEVAKELNLTQEAAQKVIDKVAPALEAQTAAHHAAQVTAWGETSRADKEFGGVKLDENLAVANKALKQFGSPELAKMLTDSGLGNHPELIRMMYRAGKAISEDTLVTGGEHVKGQAQPRTQSDYAKLLYPSKT